jgi:hypothetical protein
MGSAVLSPTELVVVGSNAIRIDMNWNVRQPISVLFVVPSPRFAIWQTFDAGGSAGYEHHFSWIV